jgi:basic membrane lipoprotein Med (substrate-binding protein (PBP1-ABC) superfamily)
MTSGAAFNGRRAAAGAVMWRGAASTLVLLAVTLALAACGGGEGDGAGAGRSTGEADRAPEGEPRPRVALLTSGPVSDAGWYAGAYEGLMMLADSLGASVSHQQTRTPAEFDEAFISYATAGYDLIFAHGFEYQDAALRAGEQFPELTIVVSGGGRVARNVIPLIFRLEEASYLAGMMAGGMTDSGTVGMVGGVEIPSAQGTFRAFEAGARAVRPDVRVLETFIGNWDDVAAAKEATVAQIRRGADVVIHNTDAAGFGVFQAVREAVEAGGTVWALGMNRDQNDLAPEVTLGSAVIRMPQAFLETARTWQAGELEGRPLYAGSDEAVVAFVINPATRSRVPAELRARIDAAADSIQAGTLEVPRVAFVDGEAGR